MPERVPGHSIEASSLIPPTGSSERHLSGLDCPHKLAADEFPVERFFRDVRLWTIASGTSEVMLIAKRLLP